MTGIITQGEKRLVLVSGRAHYSLAEKVAAELGIEILPVTAYDFANGEIYVRFNESVRGADAFVLGCTELPIVFSQCALAYSVADPTQILAEAAVAFAGYPVKKLY